MRQVKGGVPTADALADEMLSAVLDSGYLPCDKGSSVALLVNNLGGSPPIEIAVLARRAVRNLEGAARGLAVPRVFCGPFMTSLEMQGASLTVLRLGDGDLALLDAPTAAPAWAAAPPRDGPGLPADVPCPAGGGAAAGDGGAEGTYALSAAAQAAAKEATTAACNALVAMSDDLTKWDAAAGDGDCGITMARGAKAVLDGKAAEAQHGDTLMRRLARCVGDAMGGTSGALLELCFRAAAGSFVASAAENASADAAWRAAFVAGVDAIQFYGGAEQGYRTMLDALLPAKRALLAGGWQDAAKAAATGAEATKTMVALAGRANYVEAKAYEGIPDPGAKAVAAALGALVGHVAKL